MGRYVQTGEAVQTPALAAEDVGFAGVNNRLDPAQLPAGLCAEAVNLRFTEGVAASRKGIRKLNWLNRVALSEDTQRRIDPYGVIYGVGKFRDPNGFEWDVVAADGQVFLSRENQYPAVPTPLPAGVTITRPVTFTQAFNVLLMFRGADLPELQLESVSEGFKAIPADLLPNVVTGADSENPTDGTEAIPNAERGLFFQNRVFIPFRRDQVAVSDYLNYTRYSPVFSAFRINQGSSDALVALGRFNETTLIAFKEQSIYAIGNITGNLSGATLYEVTSEYGCKAPKSLAAVGKDLWFLADKRGVCSITLTEQNKIQGVDVPASQDIQKTIDRINWKYADQATAAYWQNRLYMAVPLDNAEVVKPINLVPAAPYNEDGFYKLGLREGRRYRWTKGANDLGIADGREYSGVFNLAGQAPLSGFVIGKTYLWTPEAAINQVTNGVQVLSGALGAQTFVAAGTSVVLSGVPLQPFTEGLGEVLLTENGDITVGAYVFARLFGTPELAISASLRSLFTGVNNAVLVYDFQAGKWSGHDESAVLMIADWALTTVDGKQRLVYFGADGTLNLYEEGTYDENIYEESAATIVLEPVVSRLVTRGYLFDTLKPKSFLRVLWAIATLNPTYTIELLTDGPGESYTLVLDRTKNRLRYYRPHDAPNWDPTNVHGDYLLPYREDYTWLMDADDEIFLDAKIDPELRQVIEEQAWAKGRGKYAQVRITNRTGRMEIRSLSLEAVLASKRFGVHA